MYSSHSYERLETYFDCFARHLRDAVLPNGSLLCDLGLIKTFSPKSLLLVTFLSKSNNFFVRKNYRRVYLTATLPSVQYYEE